MRWGLLLAAVFLLPFNAMACVVFVPKPQEVMDRTLYVGGGGSQLFYVLRPSPYPPLFVFDSCGEIHELSHNIENYEGFMMQIGGHNYQYFVVKSVDRGESILGFESEEDFLKARLNDKELEGWQLKQSHLMEKILLFYEKDIIVNYTLEDEKRYTKSEFEKKHFVIRKYRN